MSEITEHLLSAPGADGRWISSSPRTPAELLLSPARVSARPADGAREKFSGWNCASAHPGEEERVLNGFSLSRVPLRIITAAAAQHLSAGIPVVPPFWSNNIEKRCPSFISAPSHSRVSKLTLATQGVSGRRFGKKTTTKQYQPFFFYLFYSDRLQCFALLAETAGSLGGISVPSKWETISENLPRVPRWAQLRNPDSLVISG